MVKTWSDFLLCLKDWLWRIKEALSRRLDNCFVQILGQHTIIRYLTVWKPFRNSFVTQLFIYRNEFFLSYETDSHCSINLPRNLTFLFLRYSFLLLLNPKFPCFIFSIFQKKKVRSFFCSSFLTLMVPKKLQ